MRTAVDLFSGIGGFSRAAEANGIEVLCHVEIDSDCQEYLRREWPDVPVFGDIRAFPAHEYTGADIVMGGPPCQPVSCAGKRKGKADDRWLWGEALKVVEIVQPRWCLFENPPGIRNMGLDGIITQLEDLGYTVGTVDIPACAVQAPHIRQRYWIVCQHNDSRRGNGKSGRGQENLLGSEAFCQSADGVHLADGDRHDRRRQGTPQQGPQGRDADGRACAGYVADTKYRDAGEATKRAETIQNKQRENGRLHIGGDGGGGPWFSHHWTPSAAGKSGSPLVSVCVRSPGDPRVAERTMLGVRGDYERDRDISEGDVEHTECREIQRGGESGVVAGEGGQVKGEAQQRKRRGDAAGRSGEIWSRYHWTPCADGKVRRTPSVAELLVDGRPVDVVDALAEEGWPKRSVLKALGNSIVWQVAYRVLRAMCEADKTLNPGG